LANRVEDNLELVIVFPLEFVKLKRKFRVGSQQLTQFYKSPHDLNACLDSAFAA